MRYSPRIYAAFYLALAEDTKAHDLPELAARFWSLVWRHHNFGLRRQIMAEVMRAASRRAGVTNVDVTVARPLTATAQNHLKRELAAALGQSVQLDVIVKPHLLAGTVVTVGDHRFDASLKGRLDQLYQALAGESALS